MRDGASGELVLTHLRHRAAPLLRFRTRDHVHVRTSPCRCGRTGPRVRCIGRTDDMLIVRGVNVFPSAVREVVSAFAPAVSGHILVRPQAAGVKQEPPLPLRVELARRRRARSRARRRDPRAAARRADRRGRASSSCRSGPCRAASTSRRSSSARSTPVRKLQSQGVHHITIVGADRRTSIDFWEGLLGMPFVFEQPNLDNASESHLYFDPGDGRLITIFTNEERVPDPRPHPDRPGLRAPRRVLALAGDLPPGRGAPRRARDPAQRRQGSRVHGLDLLRGPARPADRARVLPLRAARAATPTPTCCSRRTRSGSRRGDYNIADEHLADAIEALVGRSRTSLSGRPLPEGPVPRESPSYAVEEELTWRCIR